MKKIMLLFALLFVLIPNVDARKINIPGNTVIHSGPCAYTVTGWVDVDLFPAHLNHCDLYLSGPCGKIHYTCMVIPSQEGGGEATVETHMTDADTGEAISDPILEANINEYLNDFVSN